MILEWLFTFLVFYILYKLIFNFILPVSRATSQVRNKINEMNRQQEAAHTYSNSNTAKRNPSSKPAPPAGDYIDFEEIK
ncbi:hypothetical protein [Parafilimonas sp.]|uniref:hypothetical protein n=1 Tax=Parafilimonas sp. TaxID=1969739 RepID=UPI0039E68CC4